jgi:flagellar basal-body rod modification protein FlgD
MTIVSTAGSTQGSAILDALSGTQARMDGADPSSEDRFLKLLTTQLKNQDPLNPMDNAQMTSQLAQISTVDGIEKLNATLQSLVDNSTNSEALQAAALVGHGVMVPGSGLTLQDGTALGGMELTDAADRVRVTIKDGNGLAVRTLDLGAMEAGGHLFQWDGKADSGTAAVDGAYTISVEAVRGDTALTASALQMGVVSSVSRTSQGAQLNVGTLGAFKLGDIKQII